MLHLWFNSFRLQNRKNQLITKSYLHLKGNKDQKRPMEIFGIIFGVSLVLISLIIFSIENKRQGIYEKRL
ncbi:hypothetical protein EF405_00085 [Cyclobacteriaceae bacterium YHN15]|nr:hypothetical protein EF405_00085 [Cyclobacteriaceae bacterium YHN15]